MPRVSEKEVKDIIEQYEVEIANTPSTRNVERIATLKEVVNKLKDTFVKTTKREKE